MFAHKTSLNRINPKKKQHLLTRNIAIRIFVSKHKQQTVAKMNRRLDCANRLREVLLNGKWIANTNYKEQLLSVNWEQATQKTGNLNTIAQFTFHVNYYVAGLLHAFKTGKLEISDKYSFDLPPLQSETDWNTLVANFIHNAEKFVAQVEQMDDRLMDKPFKDKKYGSYLRNIEGVIEHSYYHLGQIVLLKKMMVRN